MELKTKVEAVDGRQELSITREFDLPVELLFRAFVEGPLVEQWMGTRVLKLEGERHGSYQFETVDASGNVVFRANGTFHDVRQSERIVRTFEMENTPFPAQLEFLEFESLGADRSRLTMQVIYRSAALRDQVLQLPFAKGINMAHNRLQQALQNLK